MRRTLDISKVTIALLLLPLMFTFGASQGSEGKTVYESKCATCHGKEGKSETKAGQMTQSPDLTLKSWKSGTSLAEVEKLIREGAGKMPKYQDKLSEEEIRAVTRYVRELVGIE